MTMDQDVLAALQRIPLLAAVAPESLAVERLGGLTNRNYKITTPAIAAGYVLRIPGEKTGDYINRAVEAHNAKAAAAAGVNAEVLFFDAGDGLMLCRFLEGCVTMSPELFQTRPGAPARAARALRQMHRSGQSFDFRFELFSMIDDYLKLLAKLGAELPEGYHDVVDEAGKVRARPSTAIPCRSRPAIAIPCRRTSSMTERACGWWIGNIPA